MGSRINPVRSDKTSDPRSRPLIVVGLFCLLVSYLAACAVAPKEGDLAKAVRNQTEIRSLIEQKAIRAEAKEARLQPEGLPGWGVIRVPLTFALFDEKLNPDQSNVYLSSIYAHSREVDWQCRYSMAVPVFIRRDPATKTFQEIQFLDFGSGDCYELIVPNKKFVAYLSIFNASIDLDAAIPRQARIERIGNALNFVENINYKSYHDEAVDKRDWEAQNVAVAEVAGYYYESFSLMHVPLFEPTRNNYYRILLMGKHVIVLLAMIGPTSATLEELQAEALPVLKALRYEP